MKKQRLIFKVSTFFFFAASLMVTVTGGQKGHFQFIKTASALARTYKLEQTLCIEDGVVIGVGYICADGSQTKCTPLACDFGD
jgi:hypothetical protein